MDPLIITATPNICWLNPDAVPYPHTVDEIVAEAQQCEAAGASIFHIHAEGRWAEVVQALRAGTGMVIQCGMSSLPIPDRMPVFTEYADMISMIVSHHDEAFVGLDVHVLHPREELAEYMRLCNEHHVKPELEIWNTGSIWNMQYLIDQGLLPAPYFATLFFGWPGGAWSPPTIEEYLYRRRYMPEGSVINTSVMGPEQVQILASAIVNGDHIRVGTEDYPYLAGEIAATHALVAQAAEASRQLGRAIATPDQARQIMGMGGAA
jgi:3-keto-5-aminohexanoate cleavage enzyme